MKENEERERLLEDSIQKQLGGMKPRRPLKRRRRSWLSPVAILVAGGMVLSILVRFLMGLH